jgi:hypothetical protein
MSWVGKPFAEAKKWVYKKWEEKKAKRAKELADKQSLQIQNMAHNDARLNEIATRHGITYGSKYVRSDGFMIIVKLESVTSPNTKSTENNVYYLLVNGDLSETDLEAIKLTSDINRAYLKHDEFIKRLSVYSAKIRTVKETVDEFIDKIYNEQYIKISNHLTDVESEILFYYSLSHIQPDSVFETNIPYLGLVNKYDSDQETITLTYLKDQAIEAYNKYYSENIPSSETPKRLGGKNKRVKKTNKKLKSRRRKSKRRKN